VSSVSTGGRPRSVHAEIAARFGILPNFFRTADAAPGLVDELWNFTVAAYLNNPLPSLFKERLFVFLSRCCPVRYCIARHVGFLIGLGRPAGDAAAQPQTVDDIVALLARPIPDSATFNLALSRLSDRASPPAIPEVASAFETALFDVLNILFLTPLASPRAREAVRRATGDTNFEYIIAFLAFVRTAHYWTETHPEIEIEPDVLHLMERHEELARLLLAAPGAA
jgi:hypothetical protein